MQSVLKLAIFPFYSLFELDPSKAVFFNPSFAALIHLFSLVIFTEEVFAGRVPPSALGWLNPDGGA